MPKTYLKHFPDIYTHLYIYVYTYSIKRLQNVSLHPLLCGLSITTWKWSVCIPSLYQQNYLYIIMSMSAIPTTAISLSRAKTGSNSSGFAHNFLL